MFKIFSKKNGQSIQLKITGMHCTSCSINIDGELEDTEGVISASTSYAKSLTTVVYESEKISKDTLIKIIERLEYTAEELDG